MILLPPGWDGEDRIVSRKGLAVAHGHHDLLVRDGHVGHRSCSEECAQRRSPPASASHRTLIAALADINLRIRSIFVWGAAAFDHLGESSPKLSYLTIGGHAHVGNVLGDAIGFIASSGKR